MKNAEFEKSKVYTITEMSDYSPDGVAIKNILKRTTGCIAAVVVDKGEKITEKLSRFDHFIQILEGKAEVLIDEKSLHLSSGQCIIIPANSKNTIIANERIKMISTIIKSGYE